MKKLVKKSVGLMMALLMLFSVFAGATKVLAEEMPDKEKKLTKDNYWAELSWYKDSTHRGGYTILFKGLFCK